MVLRFVLFPSSFFIQTKRTLKHEFCKKTTCLKQFIMKNRTLLLFAILLMAFPQIYAATFYVSVNGSDSTGDGTVNSPWASLLYACGQVVMSGDHTYKSQKLHR